MNAIHTAQKMSILKVMSLASLKLSGSFLARNAKRRQKQARRPIYPRTKANAMREPSSHRRITTELSRGISRRGVGGATASHTVQMITCIKKILDSLKNITNQLIILEYLRLII